MENMTRREQFAASALSGLISASGLTLEHMAYYQKRPDMLEKMRQVYIVDSFSMADMMETYSDHGVFQEQLDLLNP